MDFVDIMCLGQKKPWFIGTANQSGCPWRIETAISGGKWERIKILLKNWLISRNQPKQIFLLDSYDTQVNKWQDNTKGLFGTAYAGFDFIYFAQIEALLREAIL